MFLIDIFLALRYNSSMTPSRVFLYICLSFVGGIASASFLHVPQFAALIFSIVGIGLATVFWKEKKAVAVGFCILVFAIGVFRYGQVQPHGAIIQDNFREEKIAFFAVVVREPDIREGYQNLVIKSESIEGNIFVRTDRWAQYVYGDEFKIEGVLKVPENFSEFDWKGYLARKDIYWTMQYPAIEVIGSGGGGSFMAALLGLKNIFREVVDENISPPQSTLFGAMVLGDKQKLTPEFKEKLNRVGLRHVTAISGLHIMILTFIIMELLIGIGLWRSHAFYVTVVVIALFILMVGAPPSAVRAGVMGGLLLLAQHVGRLSSGMRAIVFASSGMLALNPTLLQFDIGFQLSFSAIFGIIFFSQYFFEKLRHVPNPSFVPVRTVLSASFSAYITTLPILIYHFGSASLIAPLANVFVLPIVPFIFMLAIPFGLIGTLMPMAAQVLSWPLWLFLFYMTKVTDIFSQLPFASYTIWDGQLKIFVILFSVFAILLFFLHVRKRNRIVPDALEYSSNPRIY